MRNEGQVDGGSGSGHPDEKIQVGLKLAFSETISSEEKNLGQVFVEYRKRFP